MKRERTVAVSGDRCLRPRCPREAHTRGLCESCYGMAYRLVVVDGVTTWDALERAGKIAAPKRTAKSWLLEGVSS